MRKGIVVKAKLFSSPNDLYRSQRALIHLCRALVKINRDWLIEHPKTPLLYKSEVKYEEEEGEEWLAIPEVLAARVGDCEDLATWRVAELQHNGIAADVFLKHKKRSTIVGTFYAFHVMVKWPDGHIEDPSRKLGMGRKRSE